MANQNERLSKKIGFFKADLKAETHRKTFKEVYAKHNGDWTAVKAELAGKTGFGAAVVGKLEFTHRLADWSDDNPQLISLFQKDDQTNSLRDIALKFNKATFIDKVKETVAVESEEATTARAVELHGRLFRLEPTAMLVNMIKDPQVPILNDAVGAHVVAIFEKKTDFNIKTTSIYELIKNEEVMKKIPVESRVAVTAQMKILQRITTISPAADAVPVLYKAKLHSAFQISAVPQKQFMSTMSQSGLGQGTLMQIHTNAQMSQVRNEQAIMALREAGKGSGIAMIDKGMIDFKTGESFAKKLENTLQGNNLSWDLLFGDADFCECDECNSVYSAAAYYVELLQYLRNNNLDPNNLNTPQKGITGTPLEKLFGRRPDLGCLELTCKNTHTLLPYVDLVNEVMENYVAFKQLKPFNVDDETSGELLAEPQHTEYKAYCILKNEVYPFTLPYHQPVDAQRIYLKHLDTSRYELIKTFRKDNSSDDAELTRLKDQVLDRAADGEFLGLSKEEYVILTQECFVSKALMDKEKNKLHTDAEYRQIIKVKPVCQYYGYDDDATMLGDKGLTLIKKEFLRRTGIDYTTLVDLLKTRAINPRLPQGKAKYIMESLHFSYRFLQNYAKVHGLDKMAQDLVLGEKLADLVPWLKEIIDLLTRKKAPICPKANPDEVVISDQDIIHWVKCQFERVGKMIVIESGRGGANGFITTIKYPISDTVTYELAIYVHDYRVICRINDQETEIGTIDKKTGKVTITNTDYPITSESFRNLPFTGDRGEKGIFLVIDNEAYLVFFEQKDSCNLDTALLQHLDGTPLTIEEYDRIHRFIRLWRKLGWTIAETDQAIAGLSPNKTQGQASGDSLCGEEGDECAEAECDECEEEPPSTFNITPDLIHQLVAVKKLLDRTGLELIKLLSFWSDISTAGEKSLYQRLFLTHNVLGIDKIFKADEKGNYLTSDTPWSEHLPVMMAALNLSADDIQAIAADAGSGDKLTLSFLSFLYRYRLLSKALGLRIPAFIGILPLFGDVFADAHQTLQFMRRWAKMEAAGFTHQQLNYIIKGVDDKKRPFSPSKKQILQLSKAIYDGLNAIDESHKDLKADPAITDAAAQKQSIEEQASSELVRAKGSLLCDTAFVEKIIGMLEGTNLFTTNAPKNVDFTMLETNSLKIKLKYDKVSGTLQITGILTETEIADFKALSPNAAWAAALNRMQMQQDKLFKELLSGIFAGEKTMPSTEKTQLESVIKAGDVTLPLDKIPQGEANPNTAAAKRVAFLAIFLPYLRQQLRHRFIIDTLANISGLDAKVTDALVSEVLKIGTPVYDIFEQIKERSKPSETNWSGYLIPTANTDYTFIIKNSDNSPQVSIDGLPVPCTRQDDPSNEWWSEPLPLQAGKLYQLAAIGIELKNICWKTPASAITAIPSSALIPDFASKQCEPALIALKKAALLVSTFELSADEILFLDLHKADFDGLDFNTLTLVQYLRIEAYTRLRNSLPQTKLSILDFLKWTHDPAADPTTLSQQIADLSDWKKERIEKVLATDHFNLGNPEHFRSEKNLLKLQKAMTVADKIGADIDMLFEWALPISKFKVSRQIADSIRNAIRAKYSQSDWEQVVKPLQDQLRNHQKEALIAYLLQQKELITWNIVDADGLFEYFLIDVQMDAVMETSRLKQAISSVQLFIQRCFLGLEEEHNEIKPKILDRVRWEWMQRYRVWEANRKVFLYPENWIESNLRDDKSPFFKELESELLQKDISKQNVTDTLKSYLYKVDEVANMEVVGLCIERDLDENGNETDKQVKLHVFARTRNAPYFFYYRFFDVSEWNWYPWEKMQVDIPGYDVQNPATNEVTDNGCYLTPVVWNHRILIFFPQIMKKTQPVAVADKITTSKDGDGNMQVPVSKPIEYYEIKMAWSEYRNGKWTQKQLSKDAVFSDPLDDVTQIQFFKFVPLVDKNEVQILVDDNIDTSLAPDGRVFDFDGGYKGVFKFDGNSLKAAASDKNTDDMPIVYFNNCIPEAEGAYITSLELSKRRMFSWQIDSSSLVRQYPNVYFFEEESKEKLQVLNSYQCAFHHPHTQKLLGKINLGKLDLLFKENLSTTNAYDFGPFDEDNNAATPNIYHELKRPYSLYNWELFFHTPLLLADALSKAQHFEEAMKWYHFVFNPIADGEDEKRFWQFKPFKEINSQRILDSIFDALMPNTPNDAITEWRNRPFMPHLVARRRPVAYMKWVVMKYIDNLLAWGDYLFRQDTIETINQATQLYVLAGHILGPRPMMIPKRGKIKPRTYLDLLDKWDAFGNAMVELELAAPFSNQTPWPLGVINNELVFANIYGMASSLYFCIPNNPKLMGYWDTMADRLYKIRHSLNIEGIFRKLPLFEPPIDPALLVKAAAQGLSIASVLNDLNTPMPNYRFYYLLQKALELCSEVKSLGGAMLSAIEKRDNETIALIRAKHEGVMQNLLMEVKKKQLEEAEKNLDSLMQNRKGPEERMKYYLKLSGLDESLVPGNTVEFNGLPNEIVTVDGDSGLKLIPFEKEDMDKASSAADWQEAIGITETIASIFNIIPSLGGYVTPIGVGATATWGGSNLGSAASAVARGMQTHSNKLSFHSSQAGKKGGFTRALQERIFQANAAGYELKQIDKQITAQEIRMAIANLEISNQQQAIDNANEVEEFIKNKFSNEELYSWMRGSLKTLYHQVYTLAYDLAKKAEKTYCFERGISCANFIQAGYFDAGREGLLAGEQLYVGLKQLEAAYQNERGHDYEISKQLSLYQINPLAIIGLRETGSCEFALPEVLFDLDYPGHYKRRIKSLSVSIPCIAGPYTSINASLRMLENKFRNTAIGGKTYEENIEETDERFSSSLIPITAIAASSAQNDSGMFELNFKDERYLPFEGAGGISKWRLELPNFRQFDYHTIADVILHLRYTACEGGERLKAVAVKSVANKLQSIEEDLKDTGLQIAFHLKHDYPNEWHLLKKNGTVEMKIDKARLPYLAQAMNTAVENVMFLAKTPNPGALSITLDDRTVELSKVSGEWPLYQGYDSDIELDTPFVLSIASDKFEELMMIVKYTVH